MHRSLLSADVALALVNLSPDRPPGLAKLLRGTNEPASLQELLYGKRLPPAVQEALYAGHVSYLVLLALLDERSMPRWLRRRRCVSRRSSSRTGPELTGVVVRSVRVPREGSTVYFWHASARTVQQWRRSVVARWSDESST